MTEHDIPMKPIKRNGGKSLLHQNKEVSVSLSYNEKGFAKIKCDCKSTKTRWHNQLIMWRPNPVWEDGSSAGVPTLFQLGSYF